MDIRCPRCGRVAVPAGHEDARAFYQCENCNRVWMTFLAAAPPRARSDRPPARILIVDDATELVALAEAWLEDAGYAVIGATNGMQALDLVKSHDPDVVLLDLVMAPLDGVGVCEALQHQPRPPEIVLMTGIADPVRMRKLDELGGLVLLRKPLTQEIVCAAVQEALARRSGGGFGSAGGPSGAMQGRAHGSLKF